jgi:hypothetical protein
MKVSAVVISLFLAIVTCSCTKQYHQWNAGYMNDIEEIYKVQDVDNRLYNYQWFYDQYNQILAVSNNAKILTNEADKLGTLAVLNSMISEYNSHASQTRNAGKWRGNDLPYHIELSDVYK